MAADVISGDQGLPGENSEWYWDCGQQDPG